MKALKILVGVIFDIAIAGIILLFAINVINHSELETQNWRNYSVSVSMEDGIKTVYTAPVETIVVNSIEDTLKQIEIIASDVVSERN